MVLWYIDCLWFILWFFFAGKLTALDTFTCTRGPGSKIHDPSEQETYALYRKHRLVSGTEESPYDLGPPPSKKLKTPNYYLADLVHIVAMCKDRIPLVKIGKEVQNLCLCANFNSISQQMCCFTQLKYICVFTRQNRKKCTDLLPCEFTVVIDDLLLMFNWALLRLTQYFDNKFPTVTWLTL